MYLFINVLQDYKTYGGSFVYHLDEGGAPLVVCGFVVGQMTDYSGLKPTRICSLISASTRLCQPLPESFQRVSS